ncbi:Btz domain-containing protein [Mycena kentingensis (nom. inval.)]|nr:Btz domain-containing protein [Mycena kentingensis (nom. inval.)]
MPSKRAAARRRGRAPHAEDDDDEIERAAQTDSDSGSSIDDSDDSDDDESEPVSRHPSPNTSHSPDEKQPPFFSATPSAWADIVEDSAEQLPVVNFGEFDAHLRIPSPTPPSRAPPPAAPAQPARRPAGQTARQAYQQRLDSDPAFVPVVGEFWGHDDRLLNKDLRSLSGWWRGRWQGRGQARGGFFPRGRGRGGFVGNGPAAPAAEPASAASDSPMDRAWTHDGFEEMRRREEARRAAPRGATPIRAFRGRAAGPPVARPLGRPWFVMKPELMWTKQHEGFLFIDPALKPRPGQPAGLRVRMPGGPSNIVRAIPRAPRTTKRAPKSPSNAKFVVRLPPPTKAKEEAVPPPPAQDKPITVKLGPTVNASLKPDAEGWVSPDAAAVALATVSSPPSGPPPTLPIPQPAPQPAFFPFAPPPGLLGFPPGSGYPPPSFPTPQPVAFPSPPPQGFTPPPPGFSTPPPPGFGTPPNYSAPLPQGVGMDQHGGLFELATGRPVMLFNGYHTPSPSMNGLPLPVHGHNHSHSMHAHAPSLSGVDPALFAFARPKTKVEIRAPDGVGVLSPLSPRSPSRPSPLSRGESSLTNASAVPNGGAKGKLRTGAAAFVPSHAGTPGAGSGFYPARSFDAGAPPFDPSYDPNMPPGMYDAYGAYVPTQYYYGPPPGATYYHPHPGHQHSHSHSLGGPPELQHAHGAVYYQQQ